MVSLLTAASVVTDNRFGAFGADDADKSEPDFPPAFGFGLGFAAVVGSDAVSAVESLPSAASAAPALPGVVEEMDPPELSTFMPSDEPAEAASADSPEPADPSAVFVPPPIGSEEPVGVEPAVPDVASVVDVEVSDVDVSVDPVSGPAHATPGVVATATPTPRATANPPTRPTYLA